jgi:hypothetical protein
MEKVDVLLMDKSKNMNVKIRKSSDGKYWERWVSTNGTEWNLDRKLSSLEEVLKSQQEIIDNNYRNLFDIIKRK